MSIDIDALLEQEEVVLAPTHGTFDNAAIGRRIAALGEAWNDPVRPEVWLVFSSSDARRAFVQAFDPAGPKHYPHVLLFEVGANTLYANLFAGEEAFPAARALLTWLSSTWPCQVVASGSAEPPGGDEGLDD